jgi:hypothetical protein
MLRQSTHRFTVDLPLFPWLPYSVHAVSHGRHDHEATNEEELYSSHLIANAVAVVVVLRVHSPCSSETTNAT